MRPRQHRGGPSLGGSLATLACMRRQSSCIRQHVLLRAVALALVLPWTGAQGDSAVVRTGADWVAAVANHNITSLIISVPQLLVTNDDFAGYDTPLLVGRNMTVRGAWPEPERWPFVDLAYIYRKMMLKDGCSWFIRNVVYANPRRTMASMAPGGDAFAPLPPGQVAHVGLVDAAIVHDACFPTAIHVRNFQTLFRPASAPGPQRTVPQLPQPACANSSNTSSNSSVQPSSAAGTGGQGAGGVGEVPAFVSPMVRCWPGRGLYVDVVTRTMYVDPVSGVPTPDGYLLYMYNTTFLCSVYLSMECVEAYGPAGCYLQAFPKSSGNSSSSNTSVVAKVDMQDQQSGAGAGNSAALIAGVAAGVGGAVLLLLVGVAVVWHRRRMALLPPSPSKAGEPGIGAEEQQAEEQHGQLDMEAGTADEDSLGQSGGNLDAQDATTVFCTAHPVVSPTDPERPGLHLDPQHTDNELTLTQDVLGKGSFGRVMRGVYQGQEVAVKLVGDGWCTDGGSNLAENLQQEVQVLGRCQHPNVVRLLAACLTPPRLCLVMELMETSLDKMMYKTIDGCMLPLPTVLDIAQDIASGLAYLHPTIVHRDVKPANVLLCNIHSPRPVAKLTDFGLARLRSSVLVTAHPEAGTPPYTAPECFMINNSIITHHADMYSFGCVLYEMVAGRAPWSGATPMFIAHAVATHGLRPGLGTVDRDRCPDRLRSLINQCWDAVPERRPAASEVVKVLELVKQQVREQEGLGP